jgi:hypothetical protein
MSMLATCRILLFFKGLGAAGPTQNFVVLTQCYIYIQCEYHVHILSYLCSLSFPLIRSNIGPTNLNFCEYAVLNTPVTFKII